MAEPEEGQMAGAMLCHPSGLAFPVLPPDRAGDGLLARELSRLQAAHIWRAASSTGLAADVDRLEALAGLEALVKVGYLLMRLGAPEAAAMGGSGPRGPGARRGGFSVRRAGLADLDALYPLQEAYECEEVLTPIHEFNPGACRAGLARSLELQLVYVAEEEAPGGGRRIVAKAGTNARGLGVDQLGGVFTLPERRGRGAASALAAALLAEIGASGRDAALFVKPGNAAALALYRGLGFEVIGEYRADYYCA
jgi:ribosomal protein S18 acetylase RimI-like enzyme